MKRMSKMVGVGRTLYHHSMSLELVFTLSVSVQLVSVLFGYFWNKEEGGIHIKPLIVNYFR